jgi:AraC-like DNA-binding protein
MTYIPLIRANVMHGVIALLQQLNAPAERLLLEAKLSPALLQEPETLLPLRQVLYFMEYAAQKEGIEQFGLLAGQYTQIAKLGALGQLLYHSPTLQAAINTLTHLLPTYNSGDRIWVVDQGDQVWLCRKFSHQFEAAYQQAVQCSLMIMIHLVQLVAGTEWMPTTIHLATSPISGLEQLPEFTQSTIAFNQNATAIAIPKLFLSQPLHNQNDYGKQQRDQDYETLHSSAPAINFLTALRHIIGFQLKHGYPNIQSTAEIFGISVRSFQRQLGQANLTYSQLIEQVRLERTVQLLRDPNHKLADIAAEIGYTDPGNFSRAFKRWTGVSPKAYKILCPTPPPGMK